MQSIPKLGPEMDNSKFCGVIPPVIIPLHEDRSLDKEAFEFSINRMIDAGVNGLFFLGSSGEVAFLTDEERMQVLHEAIRIVDGRVPVMVGVIDIETMRVIDQVKRVSELPIDALVATAPFYALGGPCENERHFRTIRKYTDLPLFAYDLPVSVHTKLDPEMLLRLGTEGISCSRTAMQAIPCSCSPVTKWLLTAHCSAVQTAPFLALPMLTRTAIASNGKRHNAETGKKSRAYRTIWQGSCS